MMARALRWIVHLAERRADARYLAEAVRNVDAILVSYPKSGRTWLRFALSCYLAKAAALDVEPDLFSTFRILPNLDRDPARGLPAFGYSENPGLPLIAASHRHYDPILFQDRPVIFMVRDPRDVIVSSYFHVTRHKHRTQRTLKTFIEDRRYGLPLLMSYLDSWAPALARHRHLVVSYEAMSEDPAQVIRTIIEFLCLDGDEAALAHAVAASNFEAMQRDEQKNGIPGHDYDRTDGESLRMRKGRAGGFRDYLDAYDIALIENWCRSRLSPAGQALLERAGWSASTIARPRFKATPEFPGPATGVLL